MTTETTGAELAIYHDGEGWAYRLRLPRSVGWDGDLAWREETGPIDSRDEWESVVEWARNEGWDGECVMMPDDLEAGARD